MQTSEFAAIIVVLVRTQRYDFSRDEGFVRLQGGTVAV